MTYLGEAKAQWWERRPPKNSRLHEAMLRRIREAGSWSLIAALCRRYPGRFHVIHSVPILGVVYDCLLIMDASQGLHLHVNRFGSGSASGSAGGWQGLLDEWMFGGDPEDVLQRIGDSFRIDDGAKGGELTVQDRTYCAIARLLAVVVTGSSGVWSIGGLRDFAAGGPVLDEDLRNIFGEPEVPLLGLSMQELVRRREAHVYSLRRSGKCVATITTDGRATSEPAKREVDLLRLVDAPLFQVEERLLEALGLN